MSEIPSEPVRPGSLTLEQARKIVDAMVGGIRYHD